MTVQEILRYLFLNNINKSIWFWLHFKTPKNPFSKNTLQIFQNTQILTMFQLIEIENGKRIDPFFYRFIFATGDLESHTKIILIQFQMKSIKKQKPNSLHSVVVVVFSHVSHTHTQEKKRNN